MADTTGPDARRMARFFEIFESVPRGGPGDPASTRRALAMMTDLRAEPRVLDLGCGPGAGSSNLANLTGGRVTALDLHAPFVVQQAAAARAAGLSHRLDPVCADMRAAPFAAGVFDLVWSEGALYSIGFRQGLDLCARLVRPGGYVAASEVVWTVDAPPDEVRRWWHAEYPDIAPIAEKASAVTGSGLEIIDHFTLPREAWTFHFYEPMKARLGEFRRAWSGDAVGLTVDCGTRRRDRRVRAVEPRPGIRILRRPPAAQLTAGSEPDLTPTGQLSSNCNNSTGAPASSMKATSTPGDGEFGGMITFFPTNASARSSTSNATCATSRTSVGKGQSAS